MVTEVNGRKIFQVDAEPFAVSINLAETALMVIDMQKHFLYLDGFGASLGNDVTLWQID